LRTPIAGVPELFADLGAQVPWQDQDVVGLHVRQVVDGIDRDVRARQKLPVLERISVDGERKQIRSDAAVIEQGVALPRRSISGYAHAGPLAADKELNEVITCHRHLSGKAVVALHSIQPCGRLVG